MNPTRSWVDLAAIVAGPAIALSASAVRSQTAIDSTWLVIGGLVVIVTAMSAARKWRMVSFAVLLVVASVPIGIVAILAGLISAKAEKRFIGGTRYSLPVRLVKFTEAVCVTVAIFTVTDRLFFGAATMLALICCGLLAVSAVRELPSRASRQLRGALIAGVLAVVGVTGLYALTMRNHAAALTGFANAGSNVDLDELTSALHDAESAADRWYFRPLDSLPIVGQNTESARALLASGSEIAGGAADLLAYRSDPDRSLEAEIDQVCDGLRSVDAQIAEIDASAGIVPQLRRAVDRIDEDRELIATAGETCQTAALLAGMERPHSYLVLFATTAEARGTIGIVTNWARLEVARGNVEVLESGRSIPMNDELASVDAELVLPPGSEELWNRFTIERHFQDVTLSPDGIVVADAASKLISQVDPSWEPDGVIVVGPEVVAVAVEACRGLAVELEGSDDELELDGTTAADFLVRGQYELDLTYGRRVRLLTTLLEVFDERIASGACELTPSLIDHLTEVVDQGQLIVVPSDAEARSALESIGLTGSLPHASSEPLFGIVEQNAGLNKLDPYLSRTARLHWVSGTSDEPVLELDYVNDAPADLPEYVLGLDKGDAPIRVNRRRVSIYAPVPLTDISVRDGSVLDRYVGSEQGHVVTTFVFDVPPGKTTVTARLDGWSTPDALSVLVPPTPTSELVVEVAGTSQLVLGTQRVERIFPGGAD